MIENLLPPKQFDMCAADQYTEWKTWIDAFAIHATANELEEKSGEVQLATMFHCLGPSVQRIFSTLPGKTVCKLHENFWMAISHQNEMW